MQKHLKNIPKFKNEDEEFKFWQKADPFDYFDVNKAAPVNFPNLKPSTTPISIRFPSYVIDNLKVRANKMNVPYQSLIKHYVVEKLEEETGLSLKKLYGQ